jgi:hypothetical protein
MDRSSFFSRVFWRSVLVWILALTALAGLATLYFVFNWSYSDGDRAGYLQKVSRKGWLCKTYEGELAMTTVPGLAPVIWNFSVPMWKDDVATEINRHLGKKVILHYRELRYIPTSCFGETTYFVDQVTPSE